ncbi:acyl-coenzyme A thioesterase 6-like [Apus apus]|uniref:acyl-coenzyme A thioesterase 6-like n=1 Tax=Apus apus TaxID=8895 RepID=UPI0021F875B5|nr:acyl-coenzyme A thioesterase 6-like [Apus apus]
MLSPHLSSDPSVYLSLPEDQWSWSHLSSLWRIRHASVVSFLGCSTYLPCTTGTHTVAACALSICSTGGYTLDTCTMGSCMAGTCTGNIGRSHFSQYEDLPRQPTELHLEYFEEAVNYMLQQPQVKGPGIGLLGYSKGADLSLAMAAFLKNITAVASLNGPVAITAVPLCYKDKTIPPLPFDERHIKFSHSHILDSSEGSIDPFQAPGNQSLIPLEKAEAQLLFIVGQDDHVINSQYYAMAACKLLQAQGKENFQILSYPGTGHCIDPPFFPLYPIGKHPIFHKWAVLGGELRAHSKAQVHAWPQIQAFFNKYLNDS